MDMKLNKLEKSRVLFSKNIEIFRCAICKDHMMVKNNNSLICSNGHCFDISRKGYVNLINRSSNQVYNQELFEARNKIYLRGCYDPLTKELIDLIEAHRPLNNQNYILDAGCGEGYYLNQISKDKKLYGTSNFVGIDLSKEGIRMATRGNSEILWCISDLANMPLKSDKMDVILNILSPANYEEFVRVLKKDGIVIKVIPEPQYLKEIRALLGDRIKRDHYSNENVMRVFQSHLNLIAEKKLNYQWEINESDLRNLIKMTPMTSGLTAEEIETLVIRKISSITIDLKILVGQYKS